TRSPQSLDHAHPIARVELEGNLDVVPHPLGHRDRAPAVVIQHDDDDWRIASRGCLQLGELVTDRLIPDEEDRRRVRLLQRRTNGEPEFCAKRAALARPQIASRATYLDPGIRPAVDAAVRSDEAGVLRRCLDDGIDALEGVGTWVALAWLIRHSRQAFLFRSPVPGKAFLPVFVHRLRGASPDCIQERSDVSM